MYNEIDDILLEGLIEPDKLLMWLDKPKEKLLGKEIKLYHASDEEGIQGKTIKNISVNVGATKISKPRWSTYFWDNEEEAERWGITWAINGLTDSCCYFSVANKRKTQVGITRDVPKDEFIDLMLSYKPYFYIYEVTVPISKVEMGSAPGIREYTVSEEVTIDKRKKVMVTKALIEKHMDVITFEELGERLNSPEYKNMGSVRNKLLNKVLDPKRDGNRKIIRDDIRQGKITFGDDISKYRREINRALKEDYTKINEYINILNLPSSKSLFDDYIDDRLCGMYSIIESSVLAENKIMQMAINHGKKKLAKKAVKKGVKNQKEYEPVAKLSDKGNSISKKEIAKANKKYDYTEVAKELNKIVNEVKKICNSNVNIKKFINNGLTLITGNDVFELVDPDDKSTPFESNDEFVLVDIDLWDYKGGNPRIIINESPDGLHPVNHAEYELRNLIDKLLNEKFPDFYLCEYGGDWDTGSITVALK